MSLFLTSAISAALVIGLAAGPAVGAQLGLQVRDGVLIKDGKPFKGIGVNYFDCFARTLEESQ